MWILVLILLNCFFLYGEDLDFFDDESTTFEEQKESLFQSRIRFKHKNNFDGDVKEKSFIFYQSINDEHYHINYDIASDFDEMRLNLKELYYKTKLAENSFLDIGRINIREGIASAYNPTDYFKGAGLVFDSLVTSDRQENRLGALLVQIMTFLDKSTIKLIYSPKVSTGNDTVWSNKKHIGLGLNITNYTNRLSFYIDMDLHKNLNSSLIIHKDEEGVHIGTNLSYTSSSWIFYNENSVKKSQKSMTKAITELRLSKELKNQFENDEKIIYQGSLGVNYTSQNNIVTTLEYIINTGGMDKKEWRKFFSFFNKNKKYKQQLLAARKYHQINEEMLSQETLFMRISFNEVTPELNINLLAFINPHDKSTLAQIGMQYSYKEDFLFRLSVRKMFGNLLSEYGSIDNKAVMMAELEYYF